MLTAKEAADRIGKSKATILRHIKDGKLSATRDESKNYQIDPSELVRVYGGNLDEAPHEAAQATSMKRREVPQNIPDTAELLAKLDAATQLAEERERELHHRDQTIDDLRRRLDNESEERRKLTAMITDQRSQPEQPKGFWKRLTGR